MTATPKPGAVLMDTEETAAYLKLSPATLKDWRCDGDGPPYIKFGNRVRYDRRKVDRWLESRTVGAA